MTHLAITLLSALTDANCTYTSSQGTSKAWEGSRGPQRTTAPYSLQHPADVQLAACSMQTKGEHSLDPKSAPPKPAPETTTLTSQPTPDCAYSETGTTGSHRKQALFGVGLCSLSVVSTRLLPQLCESGTMAHCSARCAGHGLSAHSPHCA